MSKRQGTSDTAAELEVKKAKPHPESSSDAGSSSARAFSETEQRADVEKKANDNFMQMLIMGSKKIGKTQLVMAYLNRNHFGLEMLSKQYLTDISCGESTIRTMIWDLDSDDKFLGCRKEAYEEADVILLCFDMGKRDSFIEVSSRWYGEIDNPENKAIILVGLLAQPRQLPASEESSNLIDDCVTLKRRLNLQDFREVQKVSHEDVKNLFQYAAQLAIQKGICDKAAFSTAR